MIVNDTSTTRVQITLMYDTIYVGQRMVYSIEQNLMVNLILRPRHLFLVLLFYEFVAASTCKLYLIINTVSRRYDSKLYFTCTFVLILDSHSLPLFKVMAKRIHFVL